MQICTQTKTLTLSAGFYRDYMAYKIKKKNFNKLIAYLKKETKPLLVVKNEK